MKNVHLSDITPMIITFNEEDNIERTLSKLNWAKRIVVIDSGSTDNTLKILGQYPQVEIFYNEFESFAIQCNYGLSKIETEWVLSMDADYVLSNKLVDELLHLVKDRKVDGYYTSFKFCIHGYSLRSDNTTPRIVLYRKNKAHYIDEGHQHRVQIDGKISNAKAFIFHDDRKSLSRWLKSQDRYLLIEANKLSHSKFKELDKIDKIRKLIVLAPCMMPFYLLGFKGLILDGWYGVYYTFQRTLVELLLSIRLIEISKISSMDHTHDQQKSELPEKVLTN